jgi:hypothetical protein
MLRQVHDSPSARAHRDEPKAVIDLIERFIETLEN